MKETFGRSNYPKSDVVYWDKPVSEACPKCSASQLPEKTAKKDGTVRYCKNEDCDYKMSVESSDVTSDTTAEIGTPA